MIILSSLIDTMGFFSALAKSFVGAYGKSSSQSALSGIVLKIKFWFLFTVVFLCIYHVVYLAQCTKPSGGGGTCIVNSNNGGSNVFKLDLSSLSTGGECGVGDPYDISGQTVDWVDTGFETNGKQLIVYVDGEYFPENLCRLDGCSKCDLLKPCRRFVRYDMIDEYIKHLLEEIELLEKLP